VRLDYYAWHARTYAANTSHLSREADYAYRRILDHIFIHDQEKCRVVDDEETLIAIARCTVDEWPAIRRALIDGPAALLKKRGNWIHSPRLVEEIEKAKDKSQKYSKNARSRRSTIAEPLLDSGGESASLSHSPSPSSQVVETEESEKPSVAAQAAAAYRPLAEEWHAPGLTDRTLGKLSKRVENVTADLVAECDGFSWEELMRRARGQPFIHERISSFDFEWFLKREYQGTRLNAKKVWNGQFGSGSNRHSAVSTAKRPVSHSSAD